MRTQYCQNMRHALHPLHIDSFSTCLTCIYAYHASIDAAHITGIAQIPQQLSYLFVADVPIPHLLSGLFVAPQGPYPAYPDLVPQTSRIGFQTKRICHKQAGYVTAGGAEPSNMAMPSRHRHETRLRATDKHLVCSSTTAYHYADTTIANTTRIRAKRQSSYTDRRLSI